jgi:CBS domain containing-hemolysin-like protein
VQYLIPVLVVSILIGLNGFFVAAEFAIAGSSRPRVAYLAEQGSGAALHVLEIVSNRQRTSEYLSTAQVGITIASLGLGMYGEPTIAQWLLPTLEHYGVHSEALAHTLATVITVGFLTYLHVVLGEMVPKSLALQGPDKAAIRLYPFMAVTEKLFGPLTTVLNWIGNLLLVVLRMPQTDVRAQFVTPADLSYIVEESLEGGYLLPSEQVFLENVIDFHERSVGQVMTPRTRMVAISEDATFRSLMGMVCNQRYSRFPVFRDTRDQIVGVLHLKDLARAFVHDESSTNIADLMRPATFVPETLPLDEMLSQFREDRSQIAIVVDEYGGTAGLITLEDLAEEIIGEIQDEYDEEILPFQQIDDLTLRVRGDLLLDELDQHFDIGLSEDEAETVGGLIMSQLGRVPKADDRVTCEGIEYQVETMSGLAVYTALVRLPEGLVNLDLDVNADGDESDV